MSGQRLGLTLQLFFLRHGWVGTGLLMAALVLAVLTTVVLPQMEKSLRNESAQLQSLQRNPLPAQPIRTAKPAPAGLQVFEAALLPRKQLTAFLAESWNSAAAHAIRVAHAEYRMEADPHGGFTRLHINVPAVGRYPAIKRYALDLLAHHAGLALQKMQVKREQSASADVEAELHFILLLQNEPSP